MKKSLCLLVLAAFTLGGLAHAEGRGKKRQERKEHHEEMMKELNLKPEQKTKLDAQRKKHMETMKSLKEKKRGLHEKMEQAVGKNEGEDKLKAIHEEVKALQIQIEDERFSNMMAIRSILDDSQKKQFHELMKKKREKWKSKKPKFEDGESE